MSLKIFPLPKKIVVRQTVADMSRARYIVCEPGLSDSFIQACREFKKAVQPFFGSPLIISGAMPEKGAVLVSVKIARPGLKTQGYRLDSIKGEGVNLAAYDEAGAFYGLETLRQIIEQTGSSLPRMDISDYPDFPARGIMLDVSRAKVPSMRAMRYLIDIMARLKLNQLQLYIEHTFAFSAHEPVWHESSPFTADEIIELDMYCRASHRTCSKLQFVRPFERWLVHPEYRHLAECPMLLSHRFSNQTARASGSLTRFTPSICLTLKVLF